MHLLTACAVAAMTSAEGGGGALKYEAGSQMSQLWHRYDHVHLARFRLIDRDLPLTMLALVVALAKTIIPFRSAASRTGGPEATLVFFFAWQIPLSAAVSG